ncbi:MAG TPA: hypothetical protein VH763_03140 [Gemmatimonadales bacterium]
MTRKAVLVVILLLGAALAAISLLGELRAPLNADAAWLLYSAERVTRGQSLYVDILEINPPLIVWLNLPVALLSHALQLPATLVFRIAMGLLLAGSVGVCWSLVRRLPGVSPVGAGVAALATLFVLFPLVGGIFGQREHIALALSLPLIAATALRCQAVPIPKGFAYLLGVAAGLGFAIKPHYVVVWVLLVLYRSWAGFRRVRLLHAEDLTLMLTLVYYGVAVLLLTPNYLALAAGSARDYIVFGSHPLGYILLDDSPAIWYYVAFGAWLLFGRAPRRDALGGALAAAGVGFLVAVALQHKGWSYHFYPVNACAFLLALRTLTLPPPSPLPGPLVVRVINSAVFAIFTILVALFAIEEVRAATDRAWGPPTARQALQLAARDAVRRQKGARSILVISSQLRDGYPLVNDSGLECRASYSVMWFPLVYYRSYAGTSQQTRYRTPAEMSPNERTAFDRVVQDFVLHPPDLLVLESPPLNQRRTHFPGGFDYLAYFGQDRRFAEAARTYSDVGDVDGLLVLRRRVGQAAS